MLAPEVARRAGLHLVALDHAGDLVPRGVPVEAIGIEAELNLVENATMVEQVYTGKTYDIAVTGESAYVDPNTLIFQNFHTGETGNFVDYSNPEVDALIEEGIAATDQAARAEIYQQIQQILLEDLPWINLFVANQYEAMRPNVKGYVHIPTGSNAAIPRSPGATRSP